MNLYIETFGCQMNVADSEEMAGAFQGRGVKLIPDREKSNIVIVNTCTVRDHAEAKALSYLGRLKPWKKKQPDRVLIVAGCAAERMKTTLKKRFPHVDLVIGAKSIQDFPQIIENFFESRKKGLPKNLENQAQRYNWFTESEESFPGAKTRDSGEPLSLGNQTDTAFVTIMRGCNYTCSYCIVPFVRGREIYRSPKSIANEVKMKAEAGITKVMLLGQTVNSYWHRSQDDSMTDFADLLTQVEEIPEIHEIRFMSPHPHYMSKKLIHTLGHLQKVSPQIHLPVQSGSNKILKAMKRNYTRNDYVEMSRALRNVIPSLQLSTDFIVGFPGETEEDFNHTLSLTSEIQFSMAYCFKYSPRAGTESACFADDVQKHVKEDRLARLLKTFEN